MDRFKELWNRAKEFWGRMSRPYRVVLIANMGLLVVAFIAFALLSARDRMVQLFYTEPPKDVVYQVSEYLKENKVPFELRQGQLFVASDRRDELLINLTGAEILPEGQELFAWIYESDLLATESKQNLQWIDSTQRKLALRIASMKQISSASVSITRPPSYPILGAKSKAKAAVMLTLSSGTQLSKEHILGIARFVAGAVHRLDPQDVAIVDSAGNNYRVPDEDEFHYSSMDYLQAKKQWEDYLVEKAQKALSVIPENLMNLGIPARVIAVADVELELDSISKKTLIQEYDSVLIGRQKKDESKRDSASGPGVVPNQDGPMQAGRASVPTAEPGLVAAGTEKKTDSSTEFEAFPKSKEETETTSPPGRTKDRHLSVVVPYELAAHSYTKEPLPRKGLQIPEDPAEREKNVLASIEVWTELVMQACGIEDKTKISMTPVSFIAPLPPEALTRWDKLYNWAWEYRSSILLVALILVLLYAAWRFVKRAIPREAMEELDKLRRELEGEEKLAPEDLVTEAAQMRVSQMKEVIREQVAKNPHSAAALLRRWVQQG